LSGTAPVDHWSHDIIDYFLALPFRLMGGADLDDASGFWLSSHAF
jgi:hypothetical protein